MKIGSKDSAGFFMPSPCSFSTFDVLTDSANYCTFYPWYYGERASFEAEEILAR